MIISCSMDLSLRVWSPIKQECIMHIKSKSVNNKWHKMGINTFAIKDSRQLCISGDLEGGVYYSNYITGQLGGFLA